MTAELITCFPIELLHKIYITKKYRLVCRWTYLYTRGQKYIVRDPNYLGWLYRVRCNLRIESILPNLDLCTEIDELIIYGKFELNEDVKKYLINAKKLSIDVTVITKNIFLLSDLINLKELYLSDNQINDISSLSSLIYLEVLFLHINQIIDVSPLNTLTCLKRLCLADNQITDISPLSNLINLEYLHLSRNQITNISPLSNLIRITKLFSSDNQIVDVSSLSNLVNAEWLYLCRNQIIDRDCLHHLTKTKIYF